MIQKNEIRLASHYPITVIAYAREKGLQIDDFAYKKRIQIEEDVIVESGMELSNFILLLKFISDSLPDSGIGFDIGWRLPITAYGNVGSAILASQSLKDALDICQKYWLLIAKAVSIEVTFENQLCVIALTLLKDIDEELKNILLESMVTSLYKGCSLLSNENLDSMKVWLEQEEPIYSEKIKRHIPSVQFGMPVTRISFHSENLDSSLPMASTAGLNFSLLHCESALETLHCADLVANKVKKIIILKNQKGYPNFNELAKCLNISSRTLRRRLSEEGVSYTALLEQARKRDASRLLNDPNFSVGQVADMLGYNEISNFTRAFKKWTGSSPSNYRKKSHNL
ncbi:AraC family transcriptional regulator [Acinetobacter sp. YK3]|uniref:AraC family transcriptional regulator n=1 Tax=Acinetobacter sp. YK3 TaxID=1860097 RepID=UPI00084CD192|nr:AraC family transcriptional regulator [Acinetobacter sp. YK3]OEC91453.1 hypothetical protein A9Z07_17030 [Acinetobacter sp. YK3]